MTSLAEKTADWVVVSFAANRVISARGIRSRQVLEEMNQRGLTVELISSNAPDRFGEAGGEKSARTRARRVGSKLASMVLLDNQELEAWSRFGGWVPHFDAALLIGYPFSPLVAASRHLRAHSIPYVVDVGDPWRLTSRDSRPSISGIRGARSEFSLWEGAAGGIVTTEMQKQPLAELFPHLPILVRSNGFLPQTGVSNSPLARCPEESRTLRLAHFGNLYEPRLDPSTLLKRLADGPWERIQFAQYGEDWTGLLSDLPSEIEVRFEAPLPWEKLAACASAEHDAAVVIGNKDPSQLPSKAVDYMGLNLPRVAIVSDDPRDSLRGFAERRSGWCVLDHDQLDGADVLRQFLNDNSFVAAADDSDPDSWPSVRREMVDFVEAVRGRSA